MGKGSGKSSGNCSGTSKGKRGHNKGKGRQHHREDHRAREAGGDVLISVRDPQLIARRFRPVSEYSKKEINLDSRVLGALLRHGKISHHTGLRPLFDHGF